MSYARPFTRRAFSALCARKAGLDFFELLVPEDGELDPRETRRRARRRRPGVVLAARVNVKRDLASADPRRAEAGVAYLVAASSRRGLGADIVGGPLYGTPLVFAGRPPAPVTRGRARAQSPGSSPAHSDAGSRGRRGVRLAIEPLNRFETDFCNTAAQALALVEAGRQPGRRHHARHVPHEHGRATISRGDPQCRRRG